MKNITRTNEEHGHIEKNTSIGYNSDEFQVKGSKLIKLVLVHLPVNMHLGVMVHSGQYLFYNTTSIEISMEVSNYNSRTLFLTKFSSQSYMVYLQQLTAF